MSDLSTPFFSSLGGMLPYAPLAVLVDDEQYGQVGTLDLHADGVMIERPAYGSFMSFNPTSVNAERKSLFRYLEAHNYVSESPQERLDGLEKDNPEMSVSQEVKDHVARQQLLWEARAFADDNNSEGEILVPIEARSGKSGVLEMAGDVVSVTVSEEKYFHKEYRDEALPLRDFLAAEAQYNSPISGLSPMERLAKVTQNHDMTPGFQTVFYTLKQELRWQLDSHGLSAVTNFFDNAIAMISGGDDEPSQAPTGVMNFGPSLGIGYGLSLGLGISLSDLDPITLRRREKAH